MKRYLICLILVSLLLLSFIPGENNRAFADSLYVRKIVSLVLDDSGSMSDGSRWDYALYALQNMAAMMNPDDELYVTTLSSDKAFQIDISDQNISRAISQIQTISFGRGGTPFAPVMTGLKCLQERKVQEPNTTYWLIVLTDGEFGGIREFYPSLNDAFQGFVSEKMPNGTTTRAIYLNIGGSRNAVRADETKGLYSVNASNANDIVKAMSQISDLISGRRRFDSKDFKAIESRSITIQSPEIPLANIIVLLQNSNAKITRVQSVPNQTLEVNRAVQTQARAGRNNLFSTISRIESKSGNIHSGTYTIDFDDTVDRNSITVLYEPALEIRLTVTINGRKALRSDLSHVKVGDQVTASYAIYEAGTDNLFPLSVLGKATAGVRYQSAGVKITENSNSVSFSILDENQKMLTAWLSIPGFKTLEDNYSFIPVKQTSEGGTSTQGDMTMTIGEYQHNSNSMIYTCTVKNYENGKLVESVILSTKQELKDHHLEVKTDLPYDKSKLYGDDGKLHLQFLPDPSVKVGTYPVNVYWDGELKTTSNIVITPSSYTIQIDPEPSSMTLTKFRNTPPQYTFTLLEDGKWTAAPKDHGLSVTCDLPGSTFGFNPDGTGVLSFNDRANVVAGKYNISASIPNDNNTKPEKYTLDIIRSDAVITLSEEKIVRKQSELGGEIRFVASVTVDEAPVPFQETGLTIDLSAMPGNAQAVIGDDGTLVISMTPTIATATGNYSFSVSFSGGKAQGTLSVQPSVFRITANPSVLNLVTDQLENNQKSIDFSVYADNRLLNSKEILQLSPVITADPLPDYRTEEKENALSITPTAQAGYSYLPDGTYPITLSLPDGTQAKADVLLHSYVYTITSDSGNLVIPREKLVGNQDGVRFSILRDGIKLGEDDVNATSLQLQFSSPYDSCIKMNWSVQPDGTVLVIPYREEWEFIASFTPLGDLRVTLGIGKNNGSEDIRIVRGNFMQEWLPYRIVPLLIILYIIGMVFKRRFRYFTESYIYSSLPIKAKKFSLKKQGWISGPRLFTPTMLVPYLADRKKIGGTGIRLKGGGYCFGRNRMFYSIKSDGARYYYIDDPSIVPYEDGEIFLGSLTPLDSGDDNAKKQKWHNFPSSRRLVMFDGAQYHLYMFQ